METPKYSEIELNNFITTLIKGRHSPRDEDRLTQAFVACFNYSSWFRKIAIQFFGFPSNYTVTAEAQTISKDGKGRLDIKILNDAGNEVGVIENKIDSVLTYKQLKRYRKAGHKRIVAIAKKYPAIDVNFACFNIYRWSEFYHKIENVSTLLMPKDNLIVGGFLNYLKELGMVGLKRITRANLIEASKLLSFISRPSKKEEKKPLPAVNPFFTFNELINYFQYVWEEANKDPFLRKRLNKNFRFRPYLKLDKKWEEDEDFKYPVVCFDLYSNPWKPNLRKTVSIGLYYGIHPTDKKFRGFYLYKWFPATEKGRSIKIDHLIFKRNVVSEEYLAEIAIKKWKEWLK
jgi:hypothetical protein